MPRPKRILKKEEIAIENQINALRQRLAIERSKRQNQSTIKNINIKYNIKYKISISM